MSEGTPLLHFQVDRGRSLLITILFCLRVMTISEYFPNKFQMNYETPLSCNNKSFRGTPSAIGKLNCLRVLLLLTYFCQAPTQLPTHLHFNSIQSPLQVNSTPPRVELELCLIFGFHHHHPPTTTTTTHHITFLNYKTK